MWKKNNLKMYGLSDIGPNVPAFLVKLWKLVDDPETDELICWSESGLSFIITQQAQFARELLPLYYKHNNMASFIRQLNMYGFHKIVSVEAGGLKSEKDEMEFAHQYFMKDHPYLLENIKRKLSNSKAGVTDQILTTTLKNGAQNELLAKVLNDVNSLKGKQESWDARLAAMKRENEALWRELAIFRQKHLKQEQIINKLIHFIVTIVQPTRNVPLRRRYPLMLNDTQTMKKITKLSGNDVLNINHDSPTGPTIHEIDPTDVLFAASDETNVGNNEFISTDLTSESTSDFEVVTPESQEIVTEPIVMTESPPTTITADNPDDWLEIELTEDGMMNPLTPINPAKVNPVVAAASLKTMEGKSKTNPPIAITIPAIPNPDPLKKKPTTEKKVIYLTDVKQPIVKQQARKRGARKTSATKIEPSKKKFGGNSSSTAKDLPESPADLLLDLVRNAKESDLAAEVISSALTPPTTTVSVVPAPATTKRKLSNSSSSAPGKINQNRSKQMKKDDSNTCLSGLTVDDLDFLLSDNQPETNQAQSGDPSASKTEKQDKSFIKLESLYNGSMDEAQLAAASPAKDPVEEAINAAVAAAEVQPETTLNDISTTVDELSNDIDLTSRKTPVDPTLAYGPGSMAVVCQPVAQQTSNDELSRELSSHVESVQSEIDLLKEVLKGGEFSFDANTFLSIFPDDPLSYGMPPADDLSEKENGSGSELMTYQAPNLMDLVDLLPSNSNETSTGTNIMPSPASDWPNPPLSPMSPAVSDLTTPAPSPSPLCFPSSNKKRRK